MKFKGIITEAMIDKLPMSKFDKSVLKIFHTDNNGDENKAHYFWGLSKKLAVDIHEIVTLYMTYEKYKDFLFSEEGIEKVTSYDTLSEELVDITRDILMRYFEKKYNGKTVFDSDGISGELNMTDDIEIMIEEEMVPELWVRMPVSGQYEGIVRYGNRKGETYTTEDVNFQGSVYFGLIPYSEKGYGFDFNAFNDEAFGDWLLTKEGKKYSDQIDSGFIKTSFLKPLENYSDTELKRFCDQWVSIMKRILVKNVPILNKYKDFIEHGSSIFENKRKNKTIK